MDSPEFLWSLVRQSNETVKLKSSWRLCLSIVLLAAMPRLVAQSSMAPAASSSERRDAKIADTRADFMMRQVSFKSNEEPYESLSSGESDAAPPEISEFETVESVGATHEESAASRDTWSLTEIAPGFILRTFDVEGSAAGEQISYDEYIMTDQEPS